MPHRVPSLKSLEIFVYAGQYLSFGQAAAAVGLSPSAVSRRIRALEVELDVVLFERRSKSVALTAAGEQYLAALAPAFSAIRRATAELAESRRRLLLTMPQSFAVSWLTPRLPAFRQRHPEIDVEVDVSADITGRHADGFDLGIFLSRDGWPDHFSERLLAISVFPVCSPELAANIHDLSDLGRQTLLHVRQLPNAWDEWLNAVASAGAGVDAGAVTKSKARQKDMHFNDVQLAYEAAQRGLGVAVGADVVVGDYLQNGQLVAPFDERVPSAFSYHLVCPKARLRETSVEKFWRWIKACAAKG